MSYEELKNYVKSQKEIGVSDDDIKKSLNEKSWDPELINKAFNENTENIKQDKANTISELIKYSWNSFINNIWIYIKASLISTLLPLFSALVLLMPILYDVEVLKLTASDFISKPFLPIFISYILVVVLVTLFIAAYGNLILLTLVKSDSKLNLREAMSDSWKKLPGYFWVNILTFFIVFISLIPSILIIILVASKVILTPLSYYLIPTALLLFIPAIVISIFISFSIFSFVFDENKGFLAIKTSFKLVKNNFLFVLGRLAFLWLILMVVGQISNTLPYTNFVLGLLATPLSIIYLSKLYSETKLNTK